MDQKANGRLHYVVEREKAQQPSEVVRQVAGLMKPVAASSQYKESIADVQTCTACRRAECSVRLALGVKGYATRS